MKDIVIIIPMAGLSSRFFKEGYDRPKFMLEAKGLSLFEHSVLSFKEYFTSNHFLFIIRDINNSYEYLSKKIDSLGILNYSIEVLISPTSGQAETVQIGLEENSFKEDAGILIFNIDTFRPDFRFPENLLNWDGYLEVFKGEGENWSYAQPKSESDTQVVRTAEKKKISDLCSTGIYYFKNKVLFNEAFENITYEGNEKKKELYVAPMYNYLINRDYKIHYHLIDKSEVVFCGTPSEFENFRNND